MVQWLAYCHSFSWQLLDRVANPWDHSDPVYPSTTHVFSFS